MYSADSTKPAVDAVSAFGEPNTRWLSTDPLHAPTHLSEFQEAFTEFTHGVQVEPLNGHALAIHGSQTSFDNVLLSTCRTSPTLCIHPSAKGMDDRVMLITQRHGQCALQARGQTYDLGSGDAVFAQAGQPETFIAATPADLYLVVLSRSQLASMSIDVDAALLRPVQSHPGAAMLAHYSLMLRDHAELASPELRRAVTLHLHDLAALLAGATGDHAQVAQGRGLRAARLLAVKKDIAEHFSDGHISVEAVAKRQGITPRYLHMLLEQDGRSFTALVLEKRLALARQMLADPRLSSQAIGTIAFEVGFGDLSYFNRCFRQRYAMTPSDARWRGH